MEPIKKGKLIETEELVVVVVSVVFFVVVVVVDFTIVVVVVASGISHRPVVRTVSTRISSVPLLVPSLVLGLFDREID